MDSQDSVANLIPLPEVSEPATPELPHATILESTAAAVSRVQSSRIENAAGHMTPPPSTQVPPSNRAKTRTPTPTISHISTPPPTIEGPTQSQNERNAMRLTATATAERIAAASIEDVRNMATELQAALREARMSAAHHKLQYQMLLQESAAALERTQVEAHMAQYENEVIHVAEQAKAAATPVQTSPMQEGMIPVQKDLYQHMCREIQQLSETNDYLHMERKQQQRVITKQECEIASLSDKVTLMRDRIRESRELLTKRRALNGAVESTPRSLYSTPNRGHSQAQTQQPFAALLQASEMASQEARRPVAGKKGNGRTTHSISSLPVTPSHIHKAQTMYQTPSSRQPPRMVPSTAPMPRTSAMRTPDVYTQQSLPVPRTQGPPSEGTVSASEHGDDNDSEAETDIIEPEDSQVTESQASRAASQMLRSSQEGQQAKRDSFKGSGMLGQQNPGDRMRQTKLFGAVKKANIVRAGEDEPPAKRVRVGELPVGLGIAGVRN